jgi:hypothetical protein
MSLLEQWETREREVEAMLAEGRIDADEALRKLRRLDNPDQAPALHPQANAGSESMARGTEGQIGLNQR